MKIVVLVLALVLNRRQRVVWDCCISIQLYSSLSNKRGPKIASNQTNELPEN